MLKFLFVSCSMAIGIIHKRLHTDGEGVMTKVDMGDGIFKLQWMSISCTVILTFVTI